MKPSRCAKCNKFLIDNFYCKDCFPEPKLEGKDVDQLQDAQEESNE